MGWSLWTRRLYRQRGMGSLNKLFLVFLSTLLSLTQNTVKCKRKLDCSTYICFKLFIQVISYLYLRPLQLYLSIILYIYIKK